MVTSAQLRAARSLLNWTVRELAEKAGVHRNTVSRAETDETEHGHAVAQIIRTLEAAGIIFVEENGEGPGIRMRKFRPGDIVRARQAGHVSGIRIEKGQTGLVTVVELKTETLGTKYRVTVRFDESVPVPLSAKDIELVKPAKL